MRTADVRRTTGETDIALTLCLDGAGDFDGRTGVGFLDHMLAAFARHGRFDLTVRCTGDTWVDDHHSVEDIGLCLGQAFAEALGDKRGIERFGSTALPMDETLVLSAVDFSGRCWLGWEVPMPTEKVGSFDTELVKEFWLAFARTAACTLHVRLLAGENAHHIIEGTFKSVARTLRAAVAVTGTGIPSTKGVL